MYTYLVEVFVSIYLVASPLIVTVAIEVGTAALFRVGLAGLGAVGAVNFVTNPILTAVLYISYWRNIGGFSAGPGDPDLFAGVRSWPVLALLELMIIVAEWRILVWVLHGTAGSSRKLFALAVAMNVVSATLGTFALRYTP
jgi:hypothetical protein